MALLTRIVPCLCFDGLAEQAAKLYTEIVPNSKITQISRYGDAGHEHHGQPAGRALTVLFDLNGHRFTAMIGRPLFQFSEAISLMVFYETQQEIDHYCEKLSAGVDAAAQHCGWLKDRFGLSCQVVPSVLDQLIAHPDPAKSNRVMHALLGMKRLEIADLQRVAE